MLPILKSSYVYNDRVGPLLQLKVLYAFCVVLILFVFQGVPRTLPMSQQRSLFFSVVGGCCHDSRIAAAKCCYKVHVCSSKYRRFAVIKSTFLFFVFAATKLVKRLQLYRRPVASSPISGLLHMQLIDSFVASKFNL